MGNPSLPLTLPGRFSGNPAVWIALTFILAINVASCTIDRGKDMRMPAEPVLQIHLRATDAENRDFAFTDKKSGYYYGHTHGPGSEWYSGWNINRKRIFSDYALFTGDAVLDRRASDATVTPFELIRQWPAARETLRLFDDLEAIEVALETDRPQIGMRLFGEDLISPPVLRGNAALYSVAEDQDAVLMVAPLGDSEMTLGDHYELTGPAAAGGFLIVLAAGEEEAAALVERIRDGRVGYHTTRGERLEQLHERNRFETGNRLVDQALAWNRVSLDAMIMKQTGWGIYAGLPWFNDYWGRDMFISLPGATLVNGQLDVAGNILRSFAGFQNMDEDDPDYGRIPNRLRPDEVIYNTTDGTPRFVAQICAFLDYGGDKNMAYDLFDVVVRATEGPIRHRMDEHGYLTHGDADTWMDAREEPTKRAFSPRGNRANDIQALWFNQLTCAARLARMNEREDLADRWEQIAIRMRDRFMVDFFNNDHTYMADRITSRNVPSFSMRPNQLFVLDLVDMPGRRWMITREVWDRLVYPWGVASLDQDDINFHPWHHSPEHYHHDAAYHNGTVWIWNNGIAMQRMIEAGQPDIAWELFLNMSAQTMEQGGAGTLAENTDALPRPGEDWARLSGTFSQAWSSAEYLRVWYQFFLGIRPDDVAGRFTINPRLPSALQDVKALVPVPGGLLTVNYSVRDGVRNYAFRYEGEAAREFLLDIPEFQSTLIELDDQHTLTVVTGTRSMQLRFYGPEGRLHSERDISIDPGKRQLSEASDLYFRETSFAVPRLREDLRSLGGSRSQ